VRKFLVLFFALILFFSAIDKVPAAEKGLITFTILYDNYVFKEGLEADWGFSCLIQGTEKTILFDTGTKSSIFLGNIKKLKVNPKDVELVAISHNHGDHTGGLFAFLKENHNVSVYLPTSFPDDFFKRVENAEAKCVAVDKPVEICKDVFSTGEMGTMIIEQSLVLNTDKGLIVVTGCAHPGIVDIVKKAKEISDEKVYLVFGGFHLLQHSESQVKEIINQFRDMGVQKVGATHCTGDKAIEMFQEAYGDDFVKIGVGRVLKIT
jgi:7,8-dihydropterin-6-yl-methyl-4-(beta-D-ribofuranosyl)aminobenzene 5'-phosphate synthase